MKYFRSIRSALAILFLLSSCQAANVNLPETSTPQPQISVTSTMPPALIPSPTPAALKYPIPEWNSAKLKNVCVQLEEIYDSQSTSLSTESHRERIEQLLRELGVATGAASEECDATLNVAAGFFTSSTTYTGQDTSAAFDCVTGLSFEGLLVLTAAELPPLYAPIGNETGNAPYLTTSGCPEQSLLFDRAWTQSILEGLSKLLGPSVITAMYQSEETIHREAALWASRALGPDDLAVLPDVIDALVSNTDIFSRDQIANGVQNMGTEAQQASSVIVPSLLEELKTTGEDSFMPGLFHETIVRTFGKLGPGAKDAVPALLEMLEAPDSVVSDITILEVLGNIGPQAEIVPVLLQNAESGNAQALYALGKIGPVTPEVVLVLIQAARNHKQDFWTSAVALEALAGMQSQSPEILPFLLSAAQDNDPRYAEMAIQSLALSGTTSPEVYQLLQKSISSSKDSLQTVAIDTLKALSPGFGSQAKEMLPTLLAIARKQDMVFVAPYSAVDALSAIQKDSPEVIAAFNDILSNTHMLNDFALDNMGPEARELVPALIEALAANQVGGPQDIAFARSYIHALVSITGAYPGYRAQDWQAWWEAHPN